MKRLVKDVVGAVAPTVGAALGGPFGGLALKFLADRFVGGDTGRVEEFLVAATGDPDKVLELKKAEVEFQKFLREAGIREAELEVRDRESARDMAKSQGIKFQAGLSAIFIIGYFIILGSFFVSGGVELAEGMIQPFLILLGVLTASVPQILAFWFGSSRGSKDKDDAVASLARNAGGR